MSYFPLGKRELLIALLLCLVVAGIIGYKVFALGYEMTTVSDEEGYYVRLMMQVTGRGDDASIRLTLPINSERQQVLQERQSAADFRYTITPGRIGRWAADKLAGEHTITYSCRVRTDERRYTLPLNVDIPTTYPERLWEQLQPDERIQSADPAIVARARALIPDGMDIKSALERAYNYVYNDMRYLEVRGPTDALTALRLGEASCNGKNRLLVAILRARGIPARMVNGLIMERVRKRTTHAWTEAWVNNQWVPMCPTNGHFAEIPRHYLELAKGDVAVITRSANLGFDWRWEVREQMNQRERAILSNADHPLNLLRYWTSLKKEHISLDLIMVILMIPIAASVVAFFRNIVGFVPFGTFMPALIAVSFRETGLIFGTAMFFVVMLTATLANWGLMKLRLLHIPRLVCVITIVVMAIIGFSILCLQLGITRGAAVSLFPMAILSLTSERFTMTILVDGWREALRRALVTFIVAAACFFVINLEILQLMMIAFPELLLVNIALNIIVGSWTGLRLTELVRFNPLGPGTAPSGS